MTDQPHVLDVPVELDKPTVEDLFKQMVAAGSDVMDFHVHREPTAGKTFSPEAFDDLATTIHLFIGARTAARFEKNYDPATPGPSDMHVEVRIKLDNETFEVPDAVRPWYSIDGQHRGAR